MLEFSANLNLNRASVRASDHMDCTVAMARLFLTVMHSRRKKLHELLDDVVLSRNVRDDKAAARHVLHLG